MAVRADIGQQWHAPGYVEPKRPSGPRAMLVFVWLLVPAILGAFVLYGTVLHPYSAPKPGSRGGLAWGGTTLYTRRQVRSWLRLHGASYHVWKRRHPAALHIVTPKKHHRAHPAKRHRTR